MHCLEVLLMNTFHGQVHYLDPYDWYILLIYLYEMIIDHSLFFVAATDIALDALAE